MQKKTLYKYKRKDSGVTVSTEKPDCEYTETYRLIADEEKILTEGDIFAPVVDTDAPDIWTEIDAPAEEKTEIKETL